MKKKVMEIKKENINLDVLLFYLLLIITFDYILYHILKNNLLEPYPTVILFLVFLIELVYLISFSISNIYKITFNEFGIEIKYNFKKNVKRYSINEIKKIGVSNSQRNSMHNINFYFDDNSKISLPTSNKEDLKNVYRFFKNKGIECNVVGLPSGRKPEDYNW